MKEIIPAVEKELLERELTEDKFIRRTNNGGNLLFSITASDSPNLMREIGRLRELTFRNAGGGTGNEVDIDRYDTSGNPYKQLIVWDPDLKEILGGYRYFVCSKEAQDNTENLELATNRLFTFTDSFKNDYIPYLIELGRSFVQPAYQGTGKSRKGIFALDNLWDGLGALMRLNPEVNYFFGKVTMYPHYDREGRNMVLYFLNKYFEDAEKLIYPDQPMKTNMDMNAMKALFSGKDYQEDYKILSQEIRKMGESIPPLINSYMNLSPTMKVFGTVVNPHFGNVEETGIMITISEVNKLKIERHVDTFDPDETL